MAKKFIYIGSIPLFLMGIWFAMTTFSGVNQPPPVSLQSKSNMDSQKILVMGVGDIMLGSNYPSVQLLPPKDGADLLMEATPLLQSADIAFGNLEGVLMTGKGVPKHCRDEKHCYVFKSPDHYVHHLSAAGIDVVSIANNHTGDFGQKGREHTVGVLKKEGLIFAGHVEYPYSLFERKGVRYGFCAFAPNQGTMSVNDAERAVELISRLNDSCDILIVSMHIGAEGTKYNHVTRKQEIFLGENRGDPYHFARLVIDAGADIVFGHGPHVVRAVDVYKGRFIAYSLGNFATYGTINVKGINGYAPLVAVEMDREGRFVGGRIYSFLQEKGAGPRLDNQHRAAKEIRRLTMSDVPETSLLIDSVGVMGMK